MELQELLKIAHLLPPNTKVTLNDVEPVEVVVWKVWAGWSGNHDQRIEDATCSKCGYKHPTVYGSLKKLSPNCGGCGSKMFVEEY